MGLGWIGGWHTSWVFSLVLSGFMTISHSLRDSFGHRQVTILGHSGPRLEGQTTSDTMASSHSIAAGEAPLCCISNLPSAGVCLAAEIDGGSAAPEGGLTERLGCAAVATQEVPLCVHGV